MKTAPHVFISYARADEEHARRFANDLRSLGFPVWLDVERLQPGDPWDTTIQAALRTSSYCIVLLSPNTVDQARKRYVTRELGWALNMSTGRLNGDRFCIPVRIAPVDITDKHLARHHYIDLYPNSDDGLMKVQTAMPAWQTVQGDRVPFLAAVGGALCLPAVILAAILILCVATSQSLVDTIGLLRPLGALTLLLVFGVPIFVMLTLTRNLSSKREVFVAALIVSGLILLLLFGTAVANAAESIKESAGRAAAYRASTPRLGVGVSRLEMRLTYLRREASPPRLRSGAEPPRPNTGAAASRRLQIALQLRACSWQPARRCGFGTRDLGRAAYAVIRQQDCVSATWCTTFCAILGDYGCLAITG